MTTDVRYKCSCMPDERSVQVRYREPNEDIAHWVEQVMARAIGDDHCRISPHCRQTTMTYAKIHMPAGADHIGGPTLN